MKYLALLIGILAVRAIVDVLELDGAIDDVACLRDSTEVVFVRGYMAIGKVDPDMPENIRKLSAGRVACSAYMVPCFRCGNPRKQAQDLMAAMPLSNRRFFVHIISGQWSTNTEENRAFLRPLIEELQTNDCDAGIVTNEFYF